MCLKMIANLIPYFRQKCFSRIKTKRRRRFHVLLHSFALKIKISNFQIFFDILIEKKWFLCIFQILFKTVWGSESTKARLFNLFKLFRQKYDLTNNFVRKIRNDAKRSSFTSKRKLVLLADSSKEGNLYEEKTNEDNLINLLGFGTGRLIRM